MLVSTLIRKEEFEVLVFSRMKIDNKVYDAGIHC